MSALTTAAGAAGIVVTQLGGPTPPGQERGEEFGKTSPIALVVVLLLGIATALLIRSMSKRLRSLPASFDPPAEETLPGPRVDGAGPDDEGTGPQARRRTGEPRAPDG